MSTVVHRIRERTAPSASKVALIDGDRKFSYGELWDRVDRASAGFASLGLKKGDAVLAFLGNVHEAVECELAALQCGLPWITLTSRLTWPEVRGVLVSCSPKVVVTSEEGRLRIEHGRNEHPMERMPPVLVTESSFEDLLTAQSPRRPTEHVDVEDVARLRYTSGTTGSAKAAVLPHRVYHACLDNLLTLLSPLGATRAALHVAPLTHGSGTLLYPVFHESGTNVLVSHFDPERLFADIDRHRITTIFTVPTMLSRLVSHPAFERFDLGSLRALIYGGAPMPEAQLRLAVEKMGHALMHIYGMTEAPWPIATLPPSEHRLDNPRLRAVGRASPSCVISVADDQGSEVPPGELGEIRIRGANVMREYWKDPDATAKALKDAWLLTGDLGTKDADGVVRIVGRKKDVIISGGFNVYPEEVEAALSSHPGVLEVAVVGIPHDDWGETVVAFVVPRSGTSVTRAEIERTARSLLSGYKCPRRIEMVSDLPKNPSGKIQKSELIRAIALRDP